QARRRAIAQTRRRHHLAKFMEFAQPRRAARAGRDMRLKFARMPGVELAVDQRVHQDAGFVAIHGDTPPPSAAIQASRNIPRARASRDITVPIGASITVAISRKDRSLISRSTITSRNSAGS